MGYEFEVFTKGSPAARRPQVTIQRVGALGYNAAAVHALGDPEAIQLMYDRTHRVIGIKKVELDAPGSYAIRPVSPGAKGRVLSAKTFLIHFEIPFDVPLRYDAEMVDGILVVDLNKGGEDATSNRTRGVRARQGADAHHAGSGYRGSEVTTGGQP